MANIKLQSIHKQFGETQVIRDVSLSIDDNEFVVFVGPSGCGKSTLLRLISGLEDITEGQIEIDNERIDHLPPSQRGIAMVFQSYALYPHMTVYQNMSYALKISNESKEEIDKKVRAAAETLQLTELLNRKPKALSGGQRQRVAIGRAIVRNPKLFLFDEPLSNLDAKLRVQTRIELTKLHKKLNATMIYVTHDQVEAMTMADKIVVLRDGVVEQVGAPLELYHKPNNIFVAGFIGSPAMNFFEGTVTNISDTVVNIKLNNKSEITYPVTSFENIAIGDKVQLGIRPEHVNISLEGDSSNNGEIFAIERLGGETYIYLETKNESEVIIHVAGDIEAEVGKSIGFNFDTHACHLFGVNGTAIR